MNPTTILVLALAVFTQSTQADRPVVLDVIESGIEIFNGLDVEQNPSKSVRKVEVDNSENKNFIFKIVASAIAGKFQTPISITNITIPGVLDLQNISLTGLENAWLKISSPSGGFTLNNLTIRVPEVVVIADEYTMNQLNLGVVVLDGTGNLKISIKNFFFTTKMFMNFNVASGFKVNTLNVLAINADSSDFELENLGNSSDEISELLNGIAELALPKLVRAITNDLGQLLVAANGDCNDTNLELLCDIIGLIFTKLKDSL